MNVDDITYVEAASRHKNIPLSAIWMAESETQMIVVLLGTAEVITSLSAESYDTSTYLGDYT